MNNAHTLLDCALFTTIALLLLLRTVDFGRNFHTFEVLPLTHDN